MIQQLILKVNYTIYKAKPFFFTEKSNEKKSNYNLLYSQTQTTTSLFKNKNIKPDFSTSFLSRPKSSKYIKVNTSQCSNKVYKTEDNILSSTNSNTNVSIHNSSKYGNIVKLSKYSS